MPTFKGWLVGGAGVGIWLGGAIFEAGPLEQLGLALVALLAFAAVVVRTGRHDLAVARTLTPHRAHADQPVTVTIEVSNRGRGAAPLLLLEDRLPAGVSGSARLALQGIEPQGSRRASVTLRASRRGRYPVGPLAVSVVDPFGLARMRSEAAPAQSFLVQPHIEPLALPRDGGDRRSLRTSALRQPTGARGEEFYTLREYVEGDDLRKIHWPSTAKRGRYMIRQEETPWHTRATILLDDRAEAHEGSGSRSSFERAIEAAASLVDLYHRSGYGFRLMAAHHPGIAADKGSDHHSRCLDLLAELDETRSGPEPDALLRRLGELDSSASPEAVLVVVTGTITARHALRLAACRRRFKQVTAVSFPGHRFGTHATRARWEGEQQLVEASRLLQRAQVGTIVLGPDEALLTGWSTLSHSRTRDEVRWGQRPELV